MIPDSIQITLMGMFSGWVSLLTMLVIPVIYLFLNRDLPYKFKYLFVCIALTSGIVTIVKLVFSPIYNLFARFFPHITTDVCITYADTGWCTALQVLSFIFSYLPSVFFVAVMIVVCHMLAKKYWPKLASEMD